MVKASTLIQFCTNMEFDSLAFSAARVERAQESRVYCPACQEDCVPEEATAASNNGPTCPTCGEDTLVRPPDDERRQPQWQPPPCGAADSSAAAASSTSTSATIVNDGDVVSLPEPTTTTTAPASAVGAAGETPRDDVPATTLAASPPPLAGGTSTDRRAAVSERVAQEVLAFMAAIERGDMPTTGVGLPAPPGAAFFEELAGGGGGRRGHTAPAMEEVVAHLPRILVEENSWVLHQTVLRLTGPAELCIDAVFAPFSPPPAESVCGPVILAAPPTAEASLENEADVKGSVVLMDRGVCTFASKALRANAAGAVAAVIVQTHDVWPYVMEDSKGEAKAGGGLEIPVCMISKEKGEEIKKAMQAAGEGEGLRAELSISSSEKDCIVCQELYAVGAKLVRLPCGHLYHEACLLKWLKLSNTCPYCRRELPSSNEEVERERRSREGGGSDEVWRGFFD